MLLVLLVSRVIVFVYGPPWIFVELWNREVAVEENGTPARRVWSCLRCLRGVVLGTEGGGSSGSGLRSVPSESGRAERSVGPRVTAPRGSGTAARRCVPASGAISCATLLRWGSSGELAVCADDFGFCLCVGIAIRICGLEGEC